MTSLTGPQQRLLEVLREQCDTPGAGGYTVPAAVARAMWPDSPAWHRRTRFHAASNQGAMGGTMPMVAARMLWRLRSLGLASVRSSNQWSITSQGRQALTGAQ